MSLVFQMATEMLQGALLHFPVDLVCCAGGVKNILYAFGVGYGFSMMSNGAIILWQNAAELSQGISSSCSSAWLAALGGGLTCAYGLRLAVFLLRRQMSSSYASKLNEVQDKSDKMPLAVKLSISAFVALSQSLYCMPLQLACAAAAKSEPAPLLGFAALGLSAAGLVIESVADEQKMSAKELQPSAPVTCGLYSMCRHPNYSGEILFHLGMWGLVAHAPAWQQGLAMLGPGFMVWVMTQASKKLDRTGAEKYVDDAEYKMWFASTPVLLPRFF